jgi:hypothetical protein
MLDLGKRGLLYNSTNYSHKEGQTSSVNAIKRSCFVVDGTAR